MLTGRLISISTSIMLPSNQQRQKSKNWWKCWKIWVMRMLSETYNSIVSHCIFQAHQSMDQRKLLNTSKVSSKLSQWLKWDFIWYGTSILWKLYLSTNFRDRRVKMYNHHQRGEYDQQEEVNKQIHQLREQQIKIAGKSKLAIKYVNQILNLGKANSKDPGKK